MSGTNPVSAVLEAEEKAKNILAAAKKEAAELLSGAESSAQALCDSAENAERTRLEEAFRLEKEKGKKRFSEESDAIDRKVRKMKDFAQGRESEAVKMISEEFSGLFFTR